MSEWQDKEIQAMAATGQYFIKNTPHNLHSQHSTQQTYRVDEQEQAQI